MSSNSLLFTLFCVQIGRYVLWNAIFGRGTTFLDFTHFWDYLWYINQYQTFSHNERVWKQYYYKSDIFLPEISCMASHKLKSGATCCQKGGNCQVGIWMQHVGVGRSSVRDEHQNVRVCKNYLQLVSRSFWPCVYYEHCLSNAITLGVGALSEMVWEAVENSSWKLLENIHIFHYFLISKFPAFSESRQIDMKASIWCRKTNTSKPVWYEKSLWL